jgi:hypothetical protein
MIDAAFTHTGSADYALYQPYDTFSVNGTTLNAHEFGNYIAGYATTARFGSLGEWLTRFWGHIFAVLQHGRLDDLHSKEMIGRGAFDSMFYRPEDSICPQ